MSCLGNKLEGLGSVEITTDDLDTSIEFYTEILGGKLLETWSLDFCGEGHAERIFGYELNQARLQGVDPWTLGVPNITTKDMVQVQWRFVLFDNFILKLVQYQAPGNRPISLRDKLSSPAICPSPHLCIWLGDIDINKYIRAVENEALKRNMKFVYFNRNVELDKKEDRFDVPEDKLALYFLEGDFSPCGMAYFKGPRGEQLELLQLMEGFSEKWKQFLSKLQIPSTAFSENQTPRRKPLGITDQIYGMNHIGIRVKDLQESVRFYCDLLGGTLLPIILDNIQSDEVMYVVCQWEIFQAKADGRDFQSACIPDVRSNGKHCVNIRLVQIECVTVELLEYCSADQANPIPYSPCFDWTSPAYVNTMTLSLAVRHDVNFREFLDEITTEAKALGFPEFYVNTPLKDQTELFKGQEIEGYNYAIAKGPSGEHLAFSQFSGKCRENLHDEIQKYNGVSTLFPDLNPSKHQIQN